MKKDNIKKLICDFIDSSGNIQKSDLKNFIDTIPEDYFASYDVVIEVSKEEEPELIKALITNGFGSEDYLWSKVTRLSKTSLLFGTNSDSLCEFVVKDTLKRRYMKNLDDIALDPDGRKHVSLVSDPEVKIKKRVAVNVMVELTISSLQSGMDPKSTAYKFFTDKVKGRPADKILNYDATKIIVNSFAIGYAIAVAESEIEYNVSQPIYLNVSFDVEVEDAYSLTVLNKAKEFVSTAFEYPGGSCEINSVKLKSCNIYA